MGIALEIVMEIDLLVEVLAGLIIAAIIGGFTSAWIIYKCVHKQASELKLVKKAMSYVLRRQVQESKMLHPEDKDEIEDLEKTFRELSKSD